MFWNSLLHCREASRRIICRTRSNLIDSWTWADWPHDRSHSWRFSRDRGARWGTKWRPDSRVSSWGYLTRVALFYSIDAVGGADSLDRRKRRELCGDCRIYSLGYAMGDSQSPSAFIHKRSGPSWIYLSGATIALGTSRHRNGQRLTSRKGAWIACLTTCSTWSCNRFPHLDGSI